MNAVDKYRFNRIKRLEQKYGKYHGPKVRFDDDDDKNENNGGGSRGGGHGNTRIPYGLCQREGIDIEKDWTPKDAWNALSGKGYSAAEVYKELKGTGKVAPRTPKEPEKPKMDKKQAEQVIKDYKARGKQLKSLEKERDAFDDEYANARREQRYYSYMCGDLLKQIEDHEAKKPDYSSVDYDAWSEKNQALHSELAENTKKANEYMKIRDEKKKLRDDKTEEISAFYNAEREENKKCREAMQSIVDQSACKDKVQKSREIEQEIDGLVEENTDVVIDLETIKYRRERYQKWIDNMETDALGDIKDQSSYSFYKSKLDSCDDKIKELEQKKSDFEAKFASLKDQVAELQKGTTGKEWKQVSKYMDELDTLPEEKYTELQSYALDMRTKKVSYQNVKKHIKQPSEEEIIKNLGGGDKTGGSCASLALAYAANKAGYNVLDYRGGASKNVVAGGYSGLIRKLGGISEKSKDDFHNAHTVLKDIEEGKEYCFSAGEHAAIIRKKNGKLEYLELQSPDENGWFELNDNSLKGRFKCMSARRKGTSSATLIEVGKASENKELISYLGYINTNKDKQKKGSSGGIR